MSIGDDEQRPDASDASKPDDSTAAQEPTPYTATDPTGWQQPQAGQGLVDSASAWPPTPAWPPAPAWSPTPAWPPQMPPFDWHHPPTPGWPPQTPDSGRRRSAGLPQLLVIVSAVLIAFSGGMVADRLAFGQTQQPLSDFALYEQALQIIRSNYVGSSSVTDQQLLYGSIAGMVDSLGDTGHSRFLTPQQYQQEQTDLSGQFVGIGVVLDVSGPTPGVDRVVAGSPAQQAGVKSGDAITAIDGKPTVGLSVTDLGTLIRGAAGTKVTLSVIHAGTTVPVDIAIVRQKFTVPSVDWGMIPGTHVADIALLQFSTGASDQLQAALSQAELQGATGVVLDLRGDPGGYADQAIGVASHFLRSGVVYIQQDASGAKANQNVDKSEKHTDLPLVVLVDHNTASAAEIVAGALQDSGRAKIVGVTTFGTGTVLSRYMLSDGSAMYLGTAYWLTPSGHMIFGVGIVPDQSITLPATAQLIDPADMGKVTAAQVRASGDAQLLAALADLGQ